MIELSDNDILTTIIFIISNNESFIKIKEDYPEIAGNLDLYLLETKEKYEAEMKIFNFFRDILRKNPKALNKYIDVGKFKANLCNIDKKKLEDIIKNIERNIQNFLIDIINLLIKNKNVVDQMKFDHPKIRSELTILNYENRNKINKYFSDVSLKNKKCLTGYIKIYPNFIKEFDINKVIKKEENYSGRIFYIVNDKKSWINFAMESQTKNFRSFFVIEKNNILEVYFS